MTEFASAWAPLLSGLAPLIAPLAPSAFMDTNWQRRPLLNELGASARAALDSVSDSVTPEALLRSHRGPVKCFDVETGGWVRHEVASRDLLRKHDDGSTLYFLNVNQADELLDQWLRAVGADLGVQRGRVSVFASCQGATMPAHFDTAGNFTIQIRGRKRWRISTRPAVVHPAANHALGTPLSDELLAHVSEAPRWLPTEVMEFDLEPGGMLYLPGGFWHQTESLSDSVAISLTFDAYRWVDIVLDGLRRVLLRRDSWRESAHSFVEERPRGEDARLELKGRLAELVDVATLLVADDFMSADPVGALAINEDSLLERRALTNLTVLDATADGNVTATLSFGGIDDQAATLSGSPRDINAAVEVARFTSNCGVVSAREIIRGCPSVSLAMLENLITIGLLRQRSVGSTSSDHT